ncbi:hypothetical protein [Nocardia cyriacigeorgica]|uniref:hypothetical protein n=1 Tax=Nocardia cyriacigeorgica TaxID=135487 RepID=UPI002492A3F5|nr:hypothetical protein [Nocardia cyriacigeorgica]
MSEPSVQETAVLAALALAAHYFPQPVAGEGRVTAPFDQAAFLLSGKFRAWNRWSELPHEEKQRIAWVYKIAPIALSDPAKFAVAARTVLAPLTVDGEDDPPLAAFELVGDSPFTATAAVPRVGGDLFGFVDRRIARFRRPSARPKPIPFAGPGVWTIDDVFDKEAGLIHGRATIPEFPQFTEAFGHERLPHVASAPYLPEIPIPTADLLDLATKIDSRLEKPYLFDVLSGLFSALQTTDTVSAAELLTLVSGTTQILNAPTGTGKSVLVRVLAAWFAKNNLRVAVVLPDITACLATTEKIQEDLACLHQMQVIDHEPACAHLMSSGGMLERAETLASLITEDPDAPGQWHQRANRDLNALAYGCGLEPHLDATAPYPPGREPCLSLRTQGVGAAACPWIPDCGKYAPVYQACTADVVVMNHFMFMQGNLRIGVNLDGRPVRRMTAAEFALRTCHTVLIDEIDQFQCRAIDKSTSDISLHSRRHWSAVPQTFDVDAKRMPIADEHDLLPSVSQVRLMAEFLLLSICQNALSLQATEDERARHRVPDQTSTRWHLARGRDRRLIRLLFPDLDCTSDSEVPEDLFPHIDALIPARYGDTDPTLPRPGTPLPPEWPQIKQALSALVSPRGKHLLDAVKMELHALLDDRVKDPHTRAMAVNLLVTRTALIELDDALAELQQRAHSHRGSGLQSAHKIVEKLQSSAMITAFPQGMLGRSITGYRATGLDDKERNAELVAQTIAGDPHTFTAELGGLVSLTFAGLERPVMGLSATAYFPQAVREHLHAPVKWWMTDAQAKSIRARRHRIDYSADHPLAGEPILISGIHASRKKDALIELGSQLYDLKIHRELETAQKKDPDRAHVLVVANSYEHCGWIAQGITRAGRFSGGLCVAVRTEDRNRTDLDLPKSSSATRLTKEQFEEFPTHGRILVVPLSVVARGLNIVTGTRSAVRSVYLCVRPLADLSEPAEMYGSINAAGMNALPLGGSADPVAALRHAAEAASDRVTLLLRNPPQFTSMYKTLQEEIVAGIVIDLIQLAGRARRGGTEAVLHLVDYAFEADAWSADLPSILRRIHAKWPPDVRQRMNDLYGEALNAFLSYAGIDPAAPLSLPFDSAEHEEES